MRSVSQKVLVHTSRIVLGKYEAALAYALWWWHQRAQFVALRRAFEQQQRANTHALEALNFMRQQHTRT